MNGSALLVGSTRYRITSAAPDTLSPPMSRNVSYACSGAVSFGMFSAASAASMGSTSSPDSTASTGGGTSSASAWTASWSNACVSIPRQDPQRLSPVSTAYMTRSEIVTVAPRLTLERTREGASFVVPSERFLTYPTTGAPMAASWEMARDTASGCAWSDSTRIVPSACLPSSGVDSDHRIGGTSIRMRSACSETVSSASATSNPESALWPVCPSPDGNMGKRVPSSSVHILVASAKVASPAATSESPGERPLERNLPSPLGDESASTSITRRPARAAAMARFSATVEAPWPGTAELMRRTLPVVCPSISPRSPV